MHLHHCSCFQEHMRILLHSLRVVCKAPGGAVGILMYLEALARATGVAETFAYGFWTELHFGDEVVWMYGSLARVYEKKRWERQSVYFV